MSDGAQVQKRSLTFQDGSSNKFWTIELTGDSHTVHFGRVGTNGQAQTKSFDSAAEAKKSYDKLVAEKVKKGYTDADGSAPVAATPTPVAKTAKAKTKKATTASESGDDEPDNESVVVAAAESKTKSSAPKAVEAKPTFSATVTRRIDLDPTDWYAAGFRPKEPLSRGEPRPFDQSECIAILSKGKTANWGWDTKWDELPIPIVMSKQEAHFWLTCMTTERHRDVTSPEFAKRFENKSFDGELPFSEAMAIVHRCNRLSPSIVIPLANLVTPEELVEGWLSQDEKDKSEDVDHLAFGFMRYVRPYLTPSELEATRKIVAKHESDFVIAAPNQAFPISVYLASSLNMVAQIERFIASIGDDYYKTNSYASHYQYTQIVLTGLGSAEAVASEWRRLKLDFSMPSHARAFLACTEYLALDWLAECICRKSNREQSDELIKVLALVKAPEAAGPMMRCRLESKSANIARQWLDENVGNATAGLIPLTTGRDKVAEGAMEYLRTLKRLGHTQLIIDALKDCQQADAKAKVQAEIIDREEKVYQPLDDASTPDWLKSALEESRANKKKTPSWATPSNLPPLIVNDHRLNNDQMQTVLSTMVATSVGTKQILLQKLREFVDKSHRDEFAWKLFQLWQEDGCPSKEKWAMGSIGHLGDDHCVLKLTPLIRNWPGESQHQRAVFGLECLRAIGSNVALMQLSSIAQKLKFKGLKAKAEEFVEVIAKEKGLTRDELEDRVVPDCGLDERGKRELSFGPRSFSFVLGGDLKAMVRDADGKIRSDLPKPSSKDDTTVAEASLAEWKLMKKQIKEVATIQSRRLENAMITGRRWNQADFRLLIVQHPLMTHLAQKLIWSTFDAKGKKSSTFRISEERDFADANDDALELPGNDAVGIVHPLELTEEERKQWGQVMSDYEIVAPFAQLGREIYPLVGDEADESELKRFVGLKIVAPTLVFTLEKLGWVRGQALDGGCFVEHSKQFPAADVTVVINYEGTVGMGYIDPNEELTLEPTFFCKGMRDPGGYGWEDRDRPRLMLGKVNPIVISEVLADLQVLKSKAK